MSSGKSGLFEYGFTYDTVCGVEILDRSQGVGYTQVLIQNTSKESSDKNYRCFGVVNIPEELN